MRKIDHIFVSPFLRCLETAAGIYEALPSERRGEKIAIDWGLCGVFNKRYFRSSHENYLALNEADIRLLTLAEIAARFPSTIRFDDAHFGATEAVRIGESRSEAHIRFLRFVRVVCEKNVFSDFFNSFAVFFWYIFKIVTDSDGTSSPPFCILGQA